jgi:hypothetical protein
MPETALYLLHDKDFCQGVKKADRLVSVFRSGSEYRSFSLSDFEKKNMQKSGEENIIGKTFALQVFN